VFFGGEEGTDGSAVESHEATLGKGARCTTTGLLLVEPPAGARHDKKHAGRGESQQEERHGLATEVLKIGNPVRRVSVIIYVPIIC
jgi:hypothetical protein